MWRSLAANASLTLGCVIGVKMADKLMWNPKKYDIMKEQIEIDYWKKYGKPQVIQPELFKSSSNEGEFYQTYLRSRKKVEYMDE